MRAASALSDMEDGPTQTREDWIGTILSKPALSVASTTGPGPNKPFIAIGWRRGFGGWLVELAGKTFLVASVRLVGFN